MEALEDVGQVLDLATCDVEGVVIVSTGACLLPKSSSPERREGVREDCVSLEDGRMLDLAEFGSCS